MSDVQNKRVIIVGGGLAGMACAAALETLRPQGLNVSLLEARHALGGRASSFEDQETPGEQLDNCQHVLLGCCTNLINLYQRLGTYDRITFYPDVHFLDDTGKRHDLSAIAGLPAPLHLGPAMLLFSLLTIGERRAVVRAMRAMLRLGHAGREKLENVSFGEWLDRYAQPPELITKFYDAVLVGALNEQTRAASAKYAIQVFQDAMLAHSHGYVIGLPNCPLGELYAKGPCADLRLNTRVDSMRFAEASSPTRIQSVTLRGGEELPADAVVLATNHHAVQRWVPAELQARDDRFPGLKQLESVPILGVHLWFDRPVLRLPFAALTKGPLQWLFRKDADGRILHGVISAARDWVNIPNEQAIRQFEEQIRSLLPAARDAKLLRHVIVIEKRATFTPKPGADAFRPTQAPPPPPTGGIENLFLAGDYTKTDWPATMEGATRAGYLAAEAVAQSFGITAKFLVPDLPIEWPARWMGLR